MSLESPASIQSVAVNAARNPNRLEAREPEKCAMVLELLAGGATYKEVEEATGFNFQQIAVIKSRNGQALDVRRKQLAERSYGLAEKAAELLDRKLNDLAENEDRFNKLNPRDMGVLYGLLQDKLIQAAEGNKVVIEHRKGPSIEEAKEYLDALERAKKAAQDGSITV